MYGAGGIQIGRLLACAQAGVLKLKAYKRHEQRLRARVKLVSLPTFTKSTVILVPEAVSCPMIIRDASSVAARTCNA